MKLGALFIGASVFPKVLLASTLMIGRGDLYSGDEYVNNFSTGKHCYVYIDELNALPIGKHCYQIVARPVFTADQGKLPLDAYQMTTRVTNMHRAEYPLVKTCAMGFDGKTSGDNIYQDSSEGIFNHTASGQIKKGTETFDFILSFSPHNKKPVRTRLHRMGFWVEKNYDCRNLK